MVKGVSQPVRFILAAFQMNAPGEIFAKADFFGRFGNGPERSQSLSYEKIAAHGDLSQFLPIFVPAIATDRDGGSHCGDGHLRRVLLKSLYSKRLHRIGVLY